MFHDTIARVFSLIDPKKFQQCFLSWVSSLVSAWAEKMSLVLGQEKVSDKSNEIIAIPKLLEIKGAIVSPAAHKERLFLKKDL